MLWVAGKGSHDCTYYNLITFDPDDSSTFIKTNEIFQSYDSSILGATGNIGIDKIIFDSDNDTEITANFGLAKRTCFYFNYFNISGVLGLKRKSLDFNDTVPILDQLRKNFTEHKVFSVFFDGSFEKKEGSIISNGLLFFGKHKNFSRSASKSCELKENNELITSVWVCDFKGINFIFKDPTTNNTQKAEYKENGNLIFDIGYNSIRLSKKNIKSFRKIIE